MSQFVVFFPLRILGNFRYLTAEVLWEHWLSNTQLRLHILDAESHPLTEVVVLHRRWWLGHVSHVPDHRFVLLLHFLCKGEENEATVGLLLVLI